MMITQDFDYEKFKAEVMEYYNKHERLDKIGIIRAILGMEKRQWEDRSWTERLTDYRCKLDKLISELPNYSMSKKEFTEGALLMSDVLISVETDVRLLTGICIELMKRIDDLTPKEEK